VAQGLLEETVAPGVLRCTLNRPDHANMLTRGVMDGLRSSLTGPSMTTTSTSS